MVRFSLAAVAAAFLLTVWSADACAQAPGAGEVTLRQAWTVEEGYGDIIDYVSDAILAPDAKPEPLQVISMPRSNGGHVANGIMSDMQPLTRYLRDNLAFKADNLVAVAVSGDRLRVFVRGLDPTVFDYPHATLATAGENDWGRLHAITIADFSHFIAKSASLQGNAERQLLGDTVPPPAERAFILKLRMPTADEAQGSRVAVALEQAGLRRLGRSVSIDTERRAVNVEANLTFSEAAVERWMNTACALAKAQGAPCSNWSGKFEPLSLQMVGSPPRLRAVPRH